MRQIVLDTETTGLSTAQGHRIIEIGCVELVNRRLTGREWHRFLNPDRDIDEGAERVHGISRADLENQPRFHEIVDEFLEFVAGAELVIHNAEFDVGFIEHELALMKHPQPAIGDHATVLDSLGVDPNNGLGDLVAKIADLPEEQRSAIERDVQAAYDDGPGIAMVNSDRGITNLHVPSDVIIDASLPPMIRDSGRMWNAAGELQDCNAIIPDPSYAGIYDVVIKDCQRHGQFDPSAMGRSASPRPDPAAPARA